MTTIRHKSSNTKYGSCTMVIGDDVLLATKNMQILDTPSLTTEGSTTVKRNNIFNQKPPVADASSGECC